MKSRFDLVAVCVAVVLLSGCRSAPQPEPSTLFPDNLMGDAHRTYAAYVRAVHAGAEQPGTDIPPAYWADRIKALRPLKVYIHRVNIVAVQKKSGHVEEGTYIYIPVSSYLPRTGDDGFEFTPNAPEEGIFHFKRIGTD